MHDAMLVPDGDMAFALRLARYCARNPVALERLEYDVSARAVRYRSDKSDGPTAGRETVDPLEFLARLTAHIPNKHQVMTRYYGYYANRVRGAGVSPRRVSRPRSPSPCRLHSARHVDAGPSSSARSSRSIPSGVRRAARRCGSSPSLPSVR